MELPGPPEPGQGASVITLRFTGWRAIAAIAGVVAILVSLSLLHSVSDEQAGQLVRHYLRYQASQAYANVGGDEATRRAAGLRLEQEIDAIDRLEFVDIDVGRLLPDYLFVRRPTFFARIEVRDPATNTTTTRYFNLGRGALVLGESSARTWFWVF